MSEIGQLPKRARLPTRIARAIGSLIDPRAYLHAFKLVHYYNYSHLVARRKMTIGKGTVFAPNLSLRNGERIFIGTDSQIGERCYLWAGDESACIRIGNSVSLAPDVFITASDYQFEKGVSFRKQTKRERDVVIGNDVWLGTKVVVTAGVTVGNGCIVGAGAVVTKELPANSIAGGIPAKVIKYR